VYNHKDWTVKEYTFAEIADGKLAGDIFAYGENLAIAESTGIFDHKGVEIFDGDILEPVENPFKNVAYVTWQNNAPFGVWRKYTEGDVPIESIFPLDNSIAFAVIGNIYHNGELLKKAAI
jgi:uncharacterized phage protein (TIGR01671 family)